MSARKPRLPLYQAADADVDRFVAATGLRCPTGCGECCDTGRPWARIDDLREIAEARVARGEGEALLLAARAAGRDGSCALFEKGRLPGGCTEYELRPMLCRIFGFGAVRNKYGERELAVCKVHTRETPEVAARAAAFVKAGGDVPALADWQRAADNESDDPDPRLLPINLALESALERALLRAGFAAQAAAPTAHADDHSPDDHSIDAIDDDE